MSNDPRALNYAILGASRYDIRKIFGFFDLLPPLSAFGSDLYYKPRPLFHDPPPTSDADIISGISLSCGAEDRFAVNSVLPPGSLFHRRRRSGDALLFLRMKLSAHSSFNVWFCREHVLLRRQVKGKTRLSGRISRSSEKHQSSPTFCQPC